jgi:uncharacterized membrane protein YvbJ
MPPQSTFPCPVCGKDVPARAKACPHCGACDKTGWNEEATASDGLDLPDEDFNYEKFAEEEFGQPRKLRGKKLLWSWITVIFSVILIVLLLLGLVFWK